MLVVRGYLRDNVRDELLRYDTVLVVRGYLRDNVRDELLRYDTVLVVRGYLRDVTVRDELLDMIR
jgi:hypothetical protein